MFSTEHEITDMNQVNLSIQTLYHKSRTAEPEPHHSISFIHTYSSVLRNSIRNKKRNNDLKEDPVQKSL